MSLGHALDVRWRQQALLRLAAPEPARLNALVGGSPDGERFYTVDAAGDRWLNDEPPGDVVADDWRPRLDGGEAHRLVEWRRCPDDGRLLRTRCLSLSVAGVRMEVEALQRGSVLTDGGGDGGEVGPINYVASGCMPLLGFVVVACCGEIGDGAGHLVLYRPLAGTDGVCDCFPVCLPTPDSAWSVDVCPSHPLLAYGCNAHEVRFVEFALAPAAMQRLRLAGLDVNGRAACGFGRGSVHDLSAADRIRLSAMRYAAAEVWVREWPERLQHRHNVPRVAFGVGDEAPLACSGVKIASASLDQTVQLAWIVSPRDWIRRVQRASTGDSTASLRDAPEESAVTSAVLSPSMRHVLSPGRRDLYRDGCWFVMPISWRFWERNAEARCGPALWRWEPRRFAHAPRPDSRHEAVRAVLADAVEMEQAAEQFMRHTAHAWVVGTGYSLYLYRTRECDLSGSRCIDRCIGSLDLFDTESNALHPMFGIRFGAFSEALQLLAVALGMLPPSAGGLRLVQVDPHRGALRDWTSPRAAARDATDDAFGNPLRTVLSRLTEPICGMCFEGRELLLLDRRCRLTSIQFT